MPEEPIHGALTYRLAIMAGFTVEDAGLLGLATGGVDHHEYMKPQTAVKEILPELYAVFASAGGNPDPNGYEHYNPHRGNHETPDAVREWTNQLPKTPRLVQTVYYHYREPEVAVREVERLILQGKAMRLTDLGVALHLLEDVGMPWAPGPHRGAPWGRFPVGDNPIGHPLRLAYDGSGQLVVMAPTWDPRGGGHRQDVPYYAPYLFMTYLPEVFGFLVSARDAYYGPAGPTAATRSPLGDRLQALEKVIRATPLSNIVRLEITEAVTRKDLREAREYLNKEEILVPEVQARELPQRADVYKPGDLSRAYQRLSPAARAEINRRVDARFRIRTGLARPLDGHAYADRSNIREWLWIRDEFMAEELGRQKSGVSQAGVPQGYTRIRVPSYRDWVRANDGGAQSAVLGRYQGIEWRWSEADIDVAGYVK